VQFETTRGREITFRGATGCGHPIDKRGEIVQLIHDPADLERIVTDRGIWNWAIPGGCGFFGALILGHGCEDG